MIDATEVNEVLQATSWSVAVEDDPHVEVSPDEENPLRIAAVNGDKELFFSPSYEADELILALREHEALWEHEAGQHVTPDFYCASCREEKAGPR